MTDRQTAVDLVASFIYSGRSTAISDLSFLSLLFVARSGAVMTDRRPNFTLSHDTVALVASRRAPLRVSMPLFAPMMDSLSFVAPYSASPLL